MDNQGKGNLENLEASNGFRWQRGWGEIKITMAKNGITLIGIVTAWFM
jgi:hypothetical protein